MAKSAYQQQLETEAREAERARRSGVHQTGGGTGIADFFSKENRLKPMTRGELLGFLEMLEYSRAAHVWWRKLGRLMFGQPGIQNLPAQMRKAYWNGTLKPALEAVKAELEKKAKADAERES